MNWLQELLLPVGDFLVTPTFIVVYCGLIVLWGGAWLVALYAKTAPLRKQLAKALKKIALITENNFAKRFDGFNKDISDLSLIEHSWSEFCENLIRPDPASLEQQDQPSGTPPVIRNSREASQYFNEETLIRPVAEVRFYSSVPNHLTAFGILGTFLGLAAGIGLASAEGLGGSNIQDTQQALERLLQGASLAFVTSIAGLGSSFIFLILERIRFSNLTKAVDAFAAAIDGRLRLITTEKLWNEGLNHIKDQTGLATAAQKQLEEQTGELKLFNTDLAVAIGNALQDALGKSMTPALDQMVTLLQEIRADRAGSTDQLMQQMVRDLGEAVSGAAGSELSALAGTLGRLNSSLANAVTSMEAHHEEMTLSTRSIAENVQEAMSTASHQAQTNLEILLDRMAKQLEITTATLAGHLERASAAATQTVEGGMENIRQSAAALNDTVLTAVELLEGLENGVRQAREMAASFTDTNRHLGEFVEPLQRSAAAFSSASETTVASTAAIERAVDATAASVDQIRDAQQAMQEKWEEYGARFEGVDRSLQQVFEQIQAGLERYTEKIKKFTDETDSQMSTAVTTLSSAVSELSDTVADLEPPASNR